MEIFSKFVSYNSLAFDQILFWLYLGSNFHYAAMPMMASQILKSMDFAKTQKSRYLKNEKKNFFSNKKIH